MKWYVGYGGFIIYGNWYQYYTTKNIAVTLRKVSKQSYSYSSVLFYLRINLDKLGIKRQLYPNEENLEHLNKKYNVTALIIKLISSCLSSKTLPSSLTKKIGCENIIEKSCRHDF